jgi:hypothetical protein
MYITGSGRLSKIRKAVGMPIFEGGKPRPAEQAASADEIEKLLGAWNPWVSLGIGLGGLIVILWLMMFKPF